MNSDHEADRRIRTSRSGGSRSKRLAVESAVESGCVLVFELDGLVCERVRQMVRREGLASCAVDSVELFHRIRVRMPFELFVVGVPAADGLPDLRLTEDVDPLLLLAPLASPGAAGPLRMALPHARIVDRGLRDPDALRRALGRTPRPTSLDFDPVLRTFDPYGLSERQLEVLRRALLGEKSAEIARKLFISELTVRNHLHAIYERVGVSGRRELLGRFVRGLLETSSHSTPEGRA